METHWLALLSLGLTAALILLFIPVAQRLGMVDRPNERKRHGDPTPLVGGWAMFCGLVVGIWVSDMPFQTSGPLILGSLLLTGLGIIDDRMELSYRVRLVVQALAALVLIYWGDLRIESLGDLIGLGPIDLGILSVPFTIFALVGLINAINMLDGLDGLAGVVTLAIILPIAAFSDVYGKEHVLLVCILMGSSVMAFLLFNYRFPWRRKAVVFMGDSGSNFIGFVLGWLVLSLSQQEQQQPIAPIAVLWIVGFPVADTLTTMWRRHRKGLSPFRPDRDHVHYILQRAGFGVNATVLVVSGLCALFAVVALIASLEGFSEPLLFLAYLLLLVAHNQLHTRAWRITKRFRHLLTTAHPNEDS